MAIPDLATYKSRLLNAQVVHFRASGPPTGFGEVASLWADIGGAAPTTAAVPARDIAGALGQQNGGAGALRALGAHANTVPLTIGALHGAGSTLWLCDRLSHQGGLSGTTTGEQTTNLPTAALTRYTDGVGVMCGIELYTGVGSTPTTCTVRYTAGGVGSKNSPLIGVDGSWDTGRVLLVPINAGDAGFQSVEGVTLAASTGTAGNFGITLFKPLAIVSGIGAGTHHNYFDLITGGLSGGLPEILDDACLFLLHTSAASGLTAIFGTFYFGED